jgi:hypothetical protein
VWSLKTLVQTSIDQVILKFFQKTKKTRTQRRNEYGDRASTSRFHSI